MKKFWQKVKGTMEKKVSVNVVETITMCVLLFVVGISLGMLIASTAEEKTFTNRIITAVLDEESGTLTFSGRGAVDDFNYRMLGDLTPNQRASVRTIVFEDGITSIGNCEFDGEFGRYINLETVIFEGDINAIGDCAFSTNPNLTTVQFNGNCRQIRTLAFYQCAALESINIPDGCELGYDVLASTPLGEDRF